MIPDEEFEFRVSRASGPGGQHVNKTSTRVEVIFDVSASTALTEAQRALVQQKLANRINKEGKLVVASEGSRSQLRNRQEAASRLRELIEQALERPKTRRKSRMPRAVKRKRLDSKKRRGNVKEMRKPPKTE